MPRKKNPVRKSPKKKQENLEWISLPEEEIAYFDEDISIKTPIEEIKSEQAPFWRRAVAYLIDITFFYFVFFQIFMMVYLPRVGLNFKSIDVFQEYLLYNPRALTAVFTGVTALLFLLLFYFVLLEKYFGTTVGKKIMRLSVSGNKSYVSLVFRNLTKSVFFFLIPFDLAWYLFKKDRITSYYSGTKIIFSGNLTVDYERWT